MAYTPTTWINGDVITAEKLNNMEGGIASANEVLVFNFSLNGRTVTTDCIAQDVVSAFNSGKVCLAKITDGPAISIFNPFSNYASFLVGAEEHVFTYQSTELSITKRRLEGNVQDGTLTFSVDFVTVAKE